MPSRRKCSTAAGRSRNARPQGLARPTSTMPRVTYIAHDGKETTLDIAVGTSVMQAATFNGVDGIVAECCRSCMCATCHGYVRDDQLPLTPRMDDAADE